MTDDVVVAQIVSELEPADSKAYTDDMRAAVGMIPGATVYVTGQAAIEHDLDPVFGEDLAQGELIAVPIALLILVFTFGTLAFVLPFLFAVVTIPTALGLVWIVANFVELTTYLQNLVTLMGLGIAIDYSLLVLHRFREELHRGQDGDEAIVRTMATAGRAVVFSGTAVAIGLGASSFHAASAHARLRPRRTDHPGGVRRRGPHVPARRALARSGQGSTAYGCCRTAGSSSAPTTSAASGRGWRA